MAGQVKQYSIQNLPVATPAANGDIAFDGTGRLQYYNGTLGRITIVPDEMISLPYTFAGTLTSTVTGLSKLYLRRAYVFDSADLALGTASSSGAVTIDVLKSGTTIYTTTANRPSCAATVTHTTAVTPDVTTFANGDFLTCNLTAFGTGASTVTFTLNLRAV